MHGYDVSPRRSPYASIPAARAGQDAQGAATSATPLFDALCSEWVKAFRTLPGDRSGEEELEFVPFGLPHHSAPGTYATGPYGTEVNASNSYSAYSAGAYNARHATGQLLPQWQRVGTIGRQDTGMHHVRAALPPAPRRGL